MGGWVMESWKMILYMGFPVVAFYGYNRYVLSLEMGRLIKKEEMLKEQMVKLQMPVKELLPDS